MLLLYWGFVRDFVIVLDTRLGRYAQEQNLGMGTPRIQMSDRQRRGLRRTERHREMENVPSLIQSRQISIKK